MVRADVLGVSLPELSSGEQAERIDPITVTLGADGGIRLMAEPVERAGLVEALRALRAERPEAPVLLAADVRADAGALIELADALVGAGITRFSVVGRRADAPDGGGAAPWTPRRRGGARPAGPARPWASWPVSPCPPARRGGCRRRPSPGPGR